MRITLSAFLLLPAVLFISVRKKSGDDALLKPGEKLLFSFLVKSNHKTVMLCTGPNNQYIVYRFGTQDHADLQYPAKPDESSWKLFRYDGYSRQGIGNSPETDYKLSFKNNNVIYTLCDDWDGDSNETDVSVMVKANGKTITIKGIPSSKRGSLGRLDDLGSLIHNYYWDDNQ